MYVVILSSRKSCFSYFMLLRDALQYLCLLVIWKALAIHFQIWEGFQTRKQREEEEHSNRLM